MDAKAWEPVLLDLLIKVVAIVCLTIGALSMLTPIPTGIVLLTIGFALLIPRSPTASRWLTKLRNRYPGFDRRLKDVEPRLPAYYREALAKTRANATPEAKTTARQADLARS